MSLVYLGCGRKYSMLLRAEPDKWNGSKSLKISSPSTLPAFKTRPNAFFTSRLTTVRWTKSSTCGSFSRVSDRDESNINQLLQLWPVFLGTRIGQASECFVYWKDPMTNDTWGLNFTSPIDAKQFRECCVSREESFAVYLSIYPPSLSEILSHPPCPESSHQIRKALKADGWCVTKTFNASDWDNWN